MVLSDDVYLPTDEELKHKDIPLTHNYLVASAMWLGKYCDNQSKEFMLCRQEEGDPRKCLTYGQEVTECGLDFFKKVKKNCKEELEWYTRCLDYSGPQPNFRFCRNEQAIWDGCMFDNGFERANFGHFQLLRIHKTDRPRPKKYVPTFPDSVEGYDVTNPDNPEKLPQGLASRFWWQSLYR